MGTTLTGTTPQDTYDSLIKVTDNGPLSGSLKTLTDGLGNDSALALSTGAASVTGNLTASGASSAFTGGALEIQGAANAVKTFYLNRYGVASGSQHIIRSANAHLLIETANSEPIVLSGGNVGIGTSTPDNVLDLGAAPLGRGLTFDNYSNIFSSYSAGDLVLSNNFYGSTASDSYLTSTTATFGAAGIRISGTQGASTGGQITFFANTAAAKTAGAAFTPTEICRVTPNGLTFNGDTAAANALDDYEEGTWTMGVSFGGGTTGITYNANTGTYTKIGRQVTVNGYLALSSKGSDTGVARITGLPFTVQNSQNALSSASVCLFTVSFANQHQSFGRHNSTFIDLEEVTEAGITTTLNDANFANNSEAIVSLTYFV